MCGMPKDAVNAWQNFGVTCIRMLPIGKVAPETQCGGKSLHEVAAT